MARVAGSLATQKSCDEWYASRISHVCAKQMRYTCRLGRIYSENSMKALVNSASVHSASPPLLMHVKETGKKQERK